MTCEKDKEPVSQDQPLKQQSTTEPVENKPAETVPLLRPLYLTEGYDPEIAKKMGEQTLKPKNGRQDDG
jgi:hypothetical protein